MAVREQFTRSVSTWQQPYPETQSARRAALLADLARSILDKTSGRLRICVDGPTGAGKTSFGHELAQHIAQLGRPVFRASLDDFKRPWRDHHIYDRASGEGYYRNAFDYDAVRKLLLDPAGPAGNGKCVLCGIDPITQRDHTSYINQISNDGVLVVDGVFGFRPELFDLWEVRVWLEAGREEAFRRATTRDAKREGALSEAQALHRGRYEAADDIYVQRVNPALLAHIVVDNTNLATPRLISKQAPNEPT